jgi:hypothetical protein
MVWGVDRACRMRYEDLGVAIFRRRATEIRSNAFSPFMANSEAWRKCSRHAVMRGVICNLG